MAPAGRRSVETIDQSILSTLKPPVGSRSPDEETMRIGRPSRRRVAKKRAAIPNDIAQNAPSTVAPMLEFCSPGYDDAQRTSAERYEDGPDRDAASPANLDDICFDSFIVDAEHLASVWRAKHAVSVTRARVTMF
jgi:hypothetical protein